MFARPGFRFAPLSFAVIFASLAAACSPADLLNRLASKNGYEITRSLGYGTSSRQSLDVYRPSGKENAPMVVFFYGGSWQIGAKESYLFVAASLAQRGYVVVVPDYRLYPEVLYPAFLEDSAAAVRWARDNASRFGGDAQKIFLMGHSAGAYNAAMLTIDGRWLRAVGMDAQRDIAGLIGISGPYDFLPLKDETLKVIFGGATRPETQPISYVTPGTPPALLMTGKSDGTVDPGNSLRLAASLRAAGNTAEAITYPVVGHLSIVGTFASLLRFLAPVLHDADRFIAGISAGRDPARSRN